VLPDESRHDSTDWEQESDGCLDHRARRRVANLRLRGQTPGRETVDQGWSDVGAAGVARPFQERVPKC